MDIATRGPRSAGVFSVPRHGWGRPSGFPHKPLFPPPYGCYYTLKRISNSSRGAVTGAHPGKLFKAQTLARAQGEDGCVHAGLDGTLPFLRVLRD